MEQSREDGTQVSQEPGVTIILTIFPISQEFLGTEEPTMRTTSPTLKFLLVVLHFCLSRKRDKYSFVHLCQNRSVCDQKCDTLSLGVCSFIFSQTSTWLFLQYMQGLRKASSGLTFAFENTLGSLFQLYKYGTG